MALSGRFKAKPSWSREQSPRFHGTGSGTFAQTFPEKPITGWRFDRFSEPKWRACLPDLIHSWLLGRANAAVAAKVLWSSKTMVRTTPKRNRQRQPIPLEGIEWECELPIMDLTSPMYPHDRIACQLLLREAEQLLKQPSKSLAEDNGTEKTP